MLRRAGYLQRCRCAAVDRNGRTARIVEAVLDGRRFGIRVRELRQALDGLASARIESLHQDWGAVLGVTAGHANLSRSGAALTFTLRAGERYTVPAAAVRAVLDRSAAFAPVAAVLLAGQRASITG
ncbi:MAG: hypothetical protein GX186_05110 [Methanoculleus thermophilus]|jgi:hypothetical protein|uniref:hypothetical protein n=1 Tax=Methanoculleus thermophilus TaxID=2200 RepID=UPI0016B9329C|nr:hypothetical protein [Methanoculleus thermophilus]HQD26726.1 hypothetical protein [Methanoculleus thermophilus]